MKLKLEVPIPFVGSLEVLEIPLQGTAILSRLFDSRDLAESFPVEQIKGLLEHSLSRVLEDQYTAGDACGGWGRDYRDRFFGDLFGDEMPSDAVVHPHSISFSLWVFEGLNELAEAARRVEGVATGGVVLTRVRDSVAGYFRRHYDPATGGVGPLWSGTDRSGQVAPNVRHASSGLIAFLLLPGFLSEVEGTSRYILEALEDGAAFVNSRALGVAAMLRAVLAMSEEKLLSKGLSADGFRLQRLIGRCEMELLTRYDSATGVWDRDQPGSERARIWYTLWVLRSLPQLQESANSRLRKLYQGCLKRILGSDLIDTTWGHSLAYVPGHSPDIGATATLLAILRRDRSLPKRERRRLEHSLLRFLLHQHTSQEASASTYSWTRAMVFLALL